MASETICSHGSNCFIHLDLNFVGVRWSLKPRLSMVMTQVSMECPGWLMCHVEMSALWLFIWRSFSSFDMSFFPFIDSSTADYQQSEHDCSVFLYAHSFLYAEKYTDGMGIHLPSQHVWQQSSIIQRISIGACQNAWSNNPPNTLTKVSW